MDWIDQANHDPGMAGDGGIAVEAATRDHLSIRRGRIGFTGKQGGGAQGSVAHLCVIIGYQRLEKRADLRLIGEVGQLRKLFSSQLP